MSIMSARFVVRLLSLLVVQTFFGPCGFREDFLRLPYIVLVHRRQMATSSVGRNDCHTMLIYLLE